MAFVIHVHSGLGPLHYDLMLEGAEALATWQLAVPPTELEAGQSVAARELPDHRKLYLTYEGPIRNNRGQVEILDHGEYEPLETGDRRWVVLINGRLISGKFELSRLDPWSVNWEIRRLSED